MNESTSAAPASAKRGLADWLFEVLPPAERELLRRCAIVRNFDRALFTDVLAHDLDEAVPTFEEIVRDRMIEPLPGTSGYFRVRASFRDEFVRDWWSQDPDVAPGDIPTALRTFSGQLAAYYGERGNREEQLYHLVTADREAAAERFAELCREVEKSFDLPAYHELVRMLEERRSMLGTALAEQLVTARQRLETRSMWAQDFYETTVYYERKQTKGLFEDLIRGDDHWILHLFAAGGMGKTMYIRSVIARGCLPRDIPCARIDFDEIPHIAYVALEPWRILLLIIEQLDRQIPNRPLQELLADYRPYVADMALPTEGAPTAAATTAEDQQRFGADVIDRFITILGEVHSDRPLLLIFDTLENLRQRRLDLRAAFDMLLALHAGLPAMRVILAGRFDLSESAPPGSSLPESARLAGFVERFAGQERTVQLARFSDPDARVYLEVQRGLRGDPRVPAIIAKGEGNPFKLALLADLVRANPEITAAEIAAYKSADIAYLIKRVINRIADDDWPVRWLLRYGVIPHRLTRDFVQQVMAPHMSKNMEGDSDEDDPSRDELPRDVLGQQPFPVGEGLGQNLDFDAIWRSLLSYASTYSWVSRADESGEILVFNPNVREPMRGMLRSQPVYALLQRDAAEYFQKLALQDHTRSAEWLVESAIHMFRSGELRAEDYWYTLLSHTDKRTAAALATSVLMPKAGDEDLEVSERVRALAGFELARQALMRPGRRSIPEIAQIDEWLQPAARLEQAHAPIVHRARLIYLQAALAFHNLHYMEAGDMCVRALAAPADGRNELDLRLLHADSLAAQRHPEAAEEYLTVCQAASAAEDPEIAVAAALRGAEVLHDQERFDEAAQMCLRLGQSSKRADIIGPMLVSAVRSLALGGREGEAARAGTEAVNLLRSRAGDRRGDARFYWMCRIRAEVGLARRAPEEARAALSDLEARLGDTEPPERDPAAWPLARAELNARIDAQELDVLEAEKHLQTLALSLYDSASPRRADCLLEAAGLALDVLGDLQRCEELLGQTKTLDLTPAQQVAVELCQIAGTAYAGQVDVAHKRAVALAARPDLPDLPGLRARVAMEVVIQTPAQAREFQVANRLNRLYRALAHIPSAHYRLRLLGELRRAVPHGAALPVAKTQRFRNLLPPQDDKSIDPALGALRRAELFRVLGWPHDARALLASVEPGPADAVRLVVRRDLYLAHDRLGWTKRDLDSELPERGTPGWGSSRFLCGAMELEHAARVLTVAGDATRASRLLDEAVDLLGGLNSVWAGRIAELENRISAAARPFDHPLSLGGEHEVGRYNVEIKTGPDKSWQVIAQIEGDAQATFNFTPPWPVVSSGYELKAAVTDFARAIFSDWDAIQRSVARQLIDPLGRAGTFWERQCDLRLEVSLREVSWVPWELLLLAAAAQPSDTLTSYRTIYRPSPRLTRSGRSSAKQNVLIVRGGEALESQSERGYSIDTGQELAHVYARNNVRVRELTHPTPSGLQDALREPCRVIHIISGVRETRERLVLDFGDERFTSKDEARLTSSDIVRALYDQSTAPLLILQIVGSPSATELVRHLCLRNAFASELAAKARGVTILGTGLARGDGAQRLTEQIVTELADGLSIGSIVRGLWKGGITEQGGPDLIHNRTAVPLLGTVLFAHDPDEVFRIGDTSV